MVSQESLINEAAGYREDAEKRYQTALAALLALAWEYSYLGEEFSFDAEPELFERSLEACRELTDSCVADAKRRLVRLVNESLDTMDGENIWGENELDSIERFDMAGSHLLELLGLWVASALSRGYSKEETIALINRFRKNPQASGLIDISSLDWGRGYSKDISTQLALIGQDAIIGLSRNAEWREMASLGATYYYRRRGSSFVCPLCEDEADIPIPIDVPFTELHSRCVCFPEYHYGAMPDF